MKLLLVERQAVFGITQGVFRKTVCFAPVTNSEHERKYCKVLGKILKDKHFKSKDLDLMIQFILPVPGKRFGSIRIYDAFFTLKTLGGILNDPDMKIVVSIFSPLLLGRGVVIQTKEMSLDPNAFPIIPICNDDQVNLDKLHPVLDMLEDGSTSMLVTVTLEFEPRRRQEILSKSPMVKKEEQEVKPEKETITTEATSAEKQSKILVATSEKTEKQPKSSLDQPQSKESVSPTEELLRKRNPVVKAKRRVVGPCQSIQFKPRNDLPESIMRTIFQLNLAETKSEEQIEQPEKLVPNCEPKVQELVPPNLIKMESEVQIAPRNLLEISAELSICKKILQDEVASDAIIITKDGTLVNCHKSFLMAHSSVFTKMFQVGYAEGRPTNTLEISDMSEKSVRALLAYLYCWDQSEAIEQSSIAYELLTAGNKYDIPLLMTSMKNIFLGKPSSWYDPDVIVKLFIFARKLSTAEGSDLKEKAIKLMKENLPRIEQCPTYKELFKESPEVAMELCRIAFSA